MGRGRGLRKAQKALSRKEKGSARRRKARLRVARLHGRVADLRRDAMDKLTHRLAVGYSEICIEDLNVAGMVRNHLLAQAVEDASFFEFRRQLEYKAARSGARVHVMDRFYPSSRRCSACGTVKAKLSLGERTFHCERCGLELDRDLNAAINIMVAGSAPETLNARGGDLGRGANRAVAGETRTKRPDASGMRLGAVPGDRDMQVG